MFKKIQVKDSKNINIIRVDNMDLQNLGLYLDKDFELIYTQGEEIEEIWIKGKSTPYHKKIRDLPIQFSITFNIKESTDFYARIDYIRNFLESKKEKVITFNNENKGFKLYWFSIGDITRIAGASTITINFQCYPDIYSLI